MHKNIKGEIIQKVIKQELSSLYATHRHDLFYITVKYHQNISNGIQVIELTRNCLRADGRTNGKTPDGRQAHRYMPRIFRSGDKRTGSFAPGIDIRIDRSMYETDTK